MGAAVGSAEARVHVFEHQVATIGSSDRRGGLKNIVGNDILRTDVGQAPLVHLCAFAVGRYFQTIRSHLGPEPGRPKNTRAIARTGEHAGDPRTLTEIHVGLAVLQVPATDTGSLHLDTAQSLAVEEVEFGNTRGQSHIVDVEPLGSNVDCGEVRVGIQQTVPSLQSNRGWFDKLQSPYPRRLAPGSGDRAEQHLQRQVADGFVLQTLPVKRQIVDHCSVGTVTALFDVQAVDDDAMIVEIKIEISRQPRHRQPLIAEVLESRLTLDPQHRVAVVVIIPVQIVLELLRRRRVPGVILPRFKEPLARSRIEVQRRQFAWIAVVRDVSDQLLAIKKNLTVHLDFGVLTQPQIQLLDVCDTACHRNGKLDIRNCRIEKSGPGDRQRQIVDPRLRLPQRRLL